ncbi:MAG TPA: 50S ribosomal protein L11 methyltransferase [Pyrinomonadaceae bacterium]|nr:50S ribosomal protein L11 methyltransferase [Pyrinomonadaceae bacterium]
MSKEEGSAGGAARVWYAIDVNIERAASEAVEYALMEAGALGTESNQLGSNAPVETTETVIITAYFDAPPERERVRAALLDAFKLYELPTSSARDMNLREVADRDWLGEWKKSWQPVRVGERFIIAPPWSEIEDAEERLVIRIEPGMAFGTGTHETTRLCLEAIEKYFKGGSFLDVGTGTGILSIAAALLQPNARIEACDTDADAVAIAREIARLNNVAEKISFRTGTLDEQSTASADVVCANLTADIIVPLLPRLVEASCGRLILSGILESQAELVRRHLHELGINREIELATKGEWIALVI